MPGSLSNGRRSISPYVIRISLDLARAIWSRKAQRWQPHEVVALQAFHFREPHIEMVVDCLKNSLYS